MKVTIKHGNVINDIENRANITIGNHSDCDFVVDGVSEDFLLKFMYSKKYKNYILINETNSQNILFNNKKFSKVLVPAHFALCIGKEHETVLVVIDNPNTRVTAQRTAAQSQSSGATALKTKAVLTQDDIFNNEIEENRVAIVKEIGYKIQSLKNTIGSINKTVFMLNVATFILSVVCAFGMTNFLLGLDVDNTKSVLNLTTNFGFLTCMTAVVFAISMILKQGIFSLLDFNQNKRYGDSDIIQKIIIYIAVIFLFIVYVINLFYYKDIPGFGAASLFISLLFVGSLSIVAAGGGYFKFQLKNYNYQLTNCEYREDFESVLKSYRKLIQVFVNNLSSNRINTVRNGLLNLQMRMVVEGIAGFITAPFLAFGVSNTMAMCFPEAANWVRISGLRFSPIFLTLATFLIIFAFFLFVSAFAITKQIKSSEIIKFDGFHDYNSHGVTILGLDSMKSLVKEKNMLLFIACSIIAIEFTMNVSYFITELGDDLRGIFISLIIALVPTAILIAETNLLSSTMHKINNSNELLSMLD